MSRSTPFPSPSFGLQGTLLLTVLLSLFLAGGCASKSSIPPGATPATRHSSIKHTPANGEQAAVLRTARSLIGAPYKWGGTTPRTGFDCSGFIWFVYRQHGITLPRVSWQQFGAGRAIKYADLLPGDLIFYNVDKGSKSLHIGIITDRGTFIHAPSSGKSVMESSMNNVYWRKHYIGARRVL